MVAVSWMFCAHHAAPRRPLVPPAAARLGRRSTASGHGGNDAQKTMGIIWMLLIAAGVTGAERCRCRSGW